MSKLVPEAVVHAEAVEWRPWHEDRTTPFVAKGARGAAWVKVLSKDPETSAESLIYKLEPGWAADSLENTVYENLLVLDGEIEIGGQTLRKYAFSYRPEGYETGSVWTETGASIIAFAGAPGEPASTIPVPHLDVESMPWIARPIPLKTAKYYIKVLRADEETLDAFYLMRGIVGFVQERTDSHDAPEESYFLGGKVLFYDGVTGGRLLATAGTYIHRGANSVHGLTTVLEDHTVYKRDYFTHAEGEEEDGSLILNAYPKETAAVKALREGRVPELPKRW
jgi:hypothetical protein